MLDGKVKINGWLEDSRMDAFEFMDSLEQAGVKTVICTDISKDGAMQGVNLELYRELKNRYTMSVTASGGVSSLGDIFELRQIGVDAAIIGKAYYTGAIRIKEAIEAAR